MSKPDHAHENAGHAHRSESEYWGNPREEARDLARQGGTKTIASLGLNVMAAESGQIGQLLPKRFELEGKSYPLPTPMEELYRLTLLNVPTRGAVRDYLQRARRAYKEKSRRRATQTYENAVMASEGMAEALERKINDVSQRVSDAENRVAQKVADVVASITELHDLAKDVEANILQSFKGKTHSYNGEVPSIDQAQAASRMVFAQVAKLGKGAIEEADKSAAEDEIFKEFEATRERVNVVKH